MLELLSGEEDYGETCGAAAIFSGLLTWSSSLCRRIFGSGDTFSSSEGPLITFSGRHRHIVFEDKNFKKKIAEVTGG